MKIIISALTVLLACVAHTASAEPAWQIATRWFCKADKMTWCHNDGECSQSGSKLAVKIDFSKGIVENLGLNETYPILDKAEAEEKTHISISPITSFVIGRPDDQAIATYEFTSVVSSGSVIAHFGTCNILP